MPNTPFLLLVLPRLHSGLADGVPSPLPAGALFLWPGLPHPPRTGVFIPDYAWTPAQAAACVADFERTGREGARGAPVEAFSVATALDADTGLSAGERRALRQLMGEAPGADGASPASGADGEVRRQAAQRVLLLAWLQEKQALELRDLERRVRREQTALAGWLGEGTPAGPETGGAPGGILLPPWRPVLAAASLFLPGPSAPGRDTETAVLVVDPDLASVLAAQASALPAGTTAEADAPPGFCTVRAPLGRVLGRDRAVPDPERNLLFFYPSAWV